MRTNLKKDSKEFKIKFEKNYDNLFKILGNSFPAWSSWKIIKTRLQDMIFEEDLLKLTKDGFLETHKTQKDKQIGPEEWEPIFDVNGLPVQENLFRLKQMGFEYLNNLKIKEMNKNFLSLNKILLLLTIGLLAIGLIQTIIMILSIN